MTARLANGRLLIALFTSYTKPETSELSVLAALISYGTGSLAGRLAGCLALAAAALLNRIL